MSHLTTSSSSPYRCRCRRYGTCTGRKDGEQQQQGEEGEVSHKNNNKKKEK